MSNAGSHRLNASRNILKESCKASYTFMQRVGGACNMLPGEVLEADITATFKRHVNKQLTY